LLEEILRILAFRFNTKKLGFEVDWGRTGPLIIGGNFGDY